MLHRRLLPTPTYWLIEKREAVLHNYKVYKFNNFRLTAAKKKKEIKSTAKGPGLGTFKPMNLIARKK